MNENLKTFLSDKQVAARYGVQRTSIWRWIRNNNFPEPVKLSPGCTRWPLDRVQEWEQQKAKRG